MAQIGNGSSEQVQRACAYLDTTLAGRTLPQNVKDKCAKLRTLCEQRLWHQLSLLLEECVGDAGFQRIPGLLVDMYTNFVLPFALRLNALKLAQIAVKVSQQHAQPQQAIEFLEGTKALLNDAGAGSSSSSGAGASKGVEDEEEGSPQKEEVDTEPTLFLKMSIGQLFLQSGSTDKASDLMDLGIKMLDRMEDVDPTVTASVYSLSSQYHKVHRNFDEFYKSSLLYLAYVTTENLPADFRLALAVDISLAALLGEGIFNFGELLLHPIVQSLVGTEYEWLHALLKCFNKGDMQAYDMVCDRYSSALNRQPEMVKKADALRNKITLLCLVEYLFSLPPDSRSVPLDEIAARAKLGSREAAEAVIIQAMARGMVKGMINQVSGVVAVTWVQPRVLTHDQVQGLATRLEGWAQKVKEIEIM
ncbi:regulatory subunit of 26S proteasome [Chloropicon roscoffensis]|uniref:Regulatory subunit of 26S proteasome n=1 Tax=Chloropicon roscoffensis TaxID=1461544 RepID=A0AAX4PL84_9CHLO